MEIFKLFGSILIDSSEAEKSISKTGEQAESMGSKLASGVGTAAKWAAAITGAAVAVGGAMVSTTQDVATNMDTVDKASQRMGIAAESYQELAYAAELSGVEMSTMEKAAKKLEGTDLNLDDALSQIYELGTAEERSAKAAELFGETVAYSMTPMLNASADEMAAMRQEANDLGLVMSEDAVKSGAEMNDTFTKLKETGEALKNSLGVALMPVVNELCNGLLDFVPDIREAIEKLVPIITELLSKVGGSLMDILKSLMPLLTPLLDMIVKIAAPLAELLSEILVPIVDLLGKALEVVLPVVTEMLDKIIAKVEEFVQKIKSALGSIKDAASSVWSGIKSVFNIGGTDGSHASGLPYVPYDGYVAELHRGESVLNANQVQQLMDKLSNAGNGGATTSSVEVTLNLDGKVLARELVKPLENATKMRGGSCIA